MSCGKCTDIVKDNTTGKENVKASISYTPDGGSNSDNHDITVKVKFDDNSVPIYSYKYEIYKITDSGEEVVGGITNYKKYKNKEISVKLDSQGKYYIKTYAINSVGNKTEKKSNTFTLNYSFSCDNMIISSNRTENVWSNGDFNFTFNKSGGIYSYDVYVRIDGGADNLVINRATNRKSLSYPSSLSHTYEIRIVAYDEKGNMCSTRTYTYKQDNIPQTCVSSGGSYTWVNRDVTIYGTDYDNSGTYYQNSGPLRDISRTLTYDTDEDYSPGTVYDVAGNSTVCGTNEWVRIDKTPPKCRRTGNMEAWKNRASNTLIGHCTDDTVGGASSGCTGDSQKTYTAEGNYSGNPGPAKDRAGNVAQCPNGQTKLDRTKPKIRCSGNSSWTQGHTTVKYSASDSLSELASANSGSASITSSHTFTVKDNVGLTASCTQRVTSKTQYHKQARTWDDCKTGEPRHCNWGCASYNYDYNIVRSDTDQMCSVRGGSCSLGSHGSNNNTCDCYYNYHATSCASHGCVSHTNTCEGGWNSWQDYGWGDSPCQDVSSKRECKVVSTRKMYHS